MEILKNCVTKIDKTNHWDIAMKKTNLKIPIDSQLEIFMKT